MRGDVATGGVRQRVTPLQVITAICLLAVSLMATMTGIFSVLAVVRTLNGSANSDYVEYWAAGQLVVHGSNPYDAAATLRLEKSAGYRADKPQITWSPPIVFLLVAPLGFVGTKAGVILWTLVLGVCLAISIHLLWILCGRRSDQLHLLCYCFAPVWFCMMAGQIGIFLLLSLTLFLYLHKTSPFLAGAAFAACSVKPHLFVPFGMVLLLWALSSKRYRVLAGFGITLLAALALTTCLDPHVWSQYEGMIRIARPSDLAVPTLSRTLRTLVDHNATWVQFLPEAASCAWALWYFWKQRNCWSWMDQGMLVLLVSVLCAPYSWLTDEAVLIPAMLVGLYRAHDSKRSVLPFALVVGAALGEVLKGVWMNTPYYLWTIPAWLAWYLYATYGSRESTPEARA